VNRVIDDINSIIYSGEADYYLNGDLEVIGEFFQQFPNTIVMDDDAYIGNDNKRYYNSQVSNTLLTPSSIGINALNYRKDTIVLVYSTKRFSHNGYDVILSTQNSTNNILRVSDQNLTMKDGYKSEKDVIGWYKDIFIAPGDNDTVSFPDLIGMTLAVRGTDNGTNNYIDLETMTGFRLQGVVDNEMKVDSLMLLKLEAWDGGIDPDSITAYYGIHHGSPSTIIEGAERTYFLYSEYGDVFIGGGGEIDQVGFQVTLGGTIGTSYTTRDNSTQKATEIVVPHYTNAEEPFGLINANTTPTLNNIRIGGGSPTTNAATDIYFMVASDNTTTTGTNVAKMDADGLEINSGAFKQVQMTGSLTDGAPTDAEIDSVTGTTPSAVGAGWAVTILDSDGSGLLYRVESDGTNWVYWTGTLAS
jgi:hypothetical protein